jgi:hypothetical protein
MGRREDSRKLLCMSVFNLYYACVLSIRGRISEEEGAYVMIRGCGSLLAYHLMG